MVKEKLRVNITVDKDLIEKAKRKLNLFGGKLSTLFNAYLKDFVETMDKEPYSQAKETQLKIKELENKMNRIEGYFEAIRKKPESDNKK